MDQHAHEHQEWRDERAFEQATSRTPGAQNQDPRRIHNMDEEDLMKDSIDASSHQRSYVRQDMSQEQFMQARQLRQRAN